jgi:hypothetical protein
MNLGKGVGLVGHGVPGSMERMRGVYGSGRGGIERS